MAVTKVRVGVVQTRIGGMIGPPIAAASLNATKP